VQATAINNSGQIVGYGTNPQGQTDAFLLTPVVPEPATTGVVAASLLGLLARPRQRRSIAG
jgi:probable HAF family extracellular repeat protein